jgi:phenylacetate-CoA ligase
MQATPQGGGGCRVHPLLVRRLVLPVHEFLLRRPTFRVLRELERSQWWPAAKLRELQTAKLRRLLRHAAHAGSFYRDRIRRADIDLDRMTLDDLPRIATLSKADIRANGDEMTDAAVAARMTLYTTGGSTGETLIFKIDRGRQAADQAARARTRRWFGIEPGERELYLWGSPMELAAQDRLKLLRDRLTNHKLLSAFNMTPARMSRHLREIRRFDPVHIFGYPSSLARLVRHARQCGRRLGGRSLKAVFTTGELLIAQDRAIIEEAVSVPVVDGYGSREAGFIAHQCPRGRYHLTMESMVVELLDTDGQPVSGIESGEVTVTHLDALGMPFIRYRTGDLARWSAEPCACGRALRCLDIVEGRKTDMLRTSDGGYAHGLSVIYVLRAEPGVRQFKVVQQADLSLDVSVVADGVLDERRQDALRSQLRRRIGPGVDVRLEVVSEIAPDPSGKHRHIVCRA